MVMEKYLNEKDIPLTGKIPFHIDIVKAMINKKTIVEYKPESELTGIIRDIWVKIKYN